MAGRVSRGRQQGLPEWKEGRAFTQLVPCLHPIWILILLKELVCNCGVRVGSQT